MMDSSVQIENTLLEQCDHTTLANEELFEYLNGLWKGKKPPYVNVKVLRNTNFNNDGTLSLEDVAELPVEEKQFRTRKLVAGDIILERSGGGPKQPVGRVVFFDLPQEDYSFSNFTTCIRVKDWEVLNPEFLLYYLLSFYNQGNTNELQQRTTGIRNLNFSDYKKIAIPLPMIKEQTTIIFLLRKLQQAIEQQGKIIEKTKELKRSLMHRLFTYGLRGEELKETEIGLMPKSWELKLLESVAPFQGGFAFKSNDYKKSGVRLLKIANVSFGKVLWEDVSFLPEEYLIQHSEYVLNENDIVMAMTRPIIAGGIKVAKITVTDSPCLLNQRVGRFKANPMLNTDYLYQFLFTNKFVNYILYGAGGSQQPNISANKIGQYFIPCPSLDEQKEIANIFLNLDNKINQAEDKQINLRELFKSLLQLLMTGQVRVKDIDFGKEYE